MKKPRTFNQRLKENLKNKEFKKAFDQEEIPARIAIQKAQALELKELKKFTKSQVESLKIP